MDLMVKNRECETAAIKTNNEIWDVLRTCYIPVGSSV
jgi:hypothetical protein